MGAGLLLIVGVANLFDYIAGLLPEIVARRKVAAFFREMALHGKHDAITLNAVVYFWNGGKDLATPMDFVQGDFKLHHLKAAIDQRLLAARGPGGQVGE